MNQKCKICSISKLRNKPFHDADNKTTHSFELIHADLVGPINHSIYGHKYILTILDDFTRYNWVIFLNNKGETFNQFSIWYTQIRNIFNTRITYLKTDNGTEFLSNQFNEFCKSLGITHLLSTPYTPQQNGRVERLNGVLISTATALLEDSKLSKRFWEDAVSTASYLYNRTPHKGNYNKIPYEILYNENVNYNNLRVFGCKVVFILPKLQQHKFENNASPGIFLGYCQNPKAYKIFDIKKEKVIIARVVEFFEDSPANFYFDKEIQNVDNFKIDENNPNNVNIENHINKIQSVNNENIKHINIENNVSKYINEINKSPKYSTIEETNNFNNHQNDIQEMLNNSNDEHNCNLSLNMNNKRTSNPKINHININNKKAKVIKQSKKYDENKLREPVDYDDIFNLEDKEEWLEAVQEELNNMTNLKVYEMIKDIPSDANVISAKWIFKYKKDADGNIIKRKARLVARGFKQQYGIDYIDTFAPTLKKDSLRIITAISVQNGFKIHQIDITAAYLNADLSENIYMDAPQGHPGFKKSFWKLKKALYGLKQSGKEWNSKLNNVLINIGFSRLLSEPCLYKKVNKNNKLICIIGVYVDDIVLAGTSEEINKTKGKIKKIFVTKDIGNVNFIVGIKYQKYKDGYILNQRRYTLDLLDKYKYLIKNQLNNMKPIIIQKLKYIKANPTEYRSIIGNLLYLAICTRPDILFATTKAARKSQCPTKEDLINLTKILEYLYGSFNYGLYFTKNSTIKAYSDADFGGDTKTRRSTTGYIIFFGNTPISWCSKLQHCVSTSTCEAEFYSLSECTKQCLWIQNLLNELGINKKPIKIYIDNKSTIHITKNHLINQKSKHIDIRYHFIKELIENGKIQIEYIKSEDNPADGLTKYLNNTQMKKFRNNTLFNLL